jgi:hypothetical protein
VRRHDVAVDPTTPRSRISQLNERVSRNGQASARGAVLGCIRPSRSTCTSIAFRQFNRRLAPRLGTRLGRYPVHQPAPPTGRIDCMERTAWPNQRATRTAPDGPRVPGNSVRTHSRVRASSCREDVGTGEPAPCGIYRWCRHANSCLTRSAIAVAASPAPGQVDARRAPRPTPHRGRPGPRRHRRAGAGALSAAWRAHTSARPPGRPLLP